jgi:hypothetical protein
MSGFVVNSKDNIRASGIERQVDIPWDAKLVAYSEQYGTVYDALRTLFTGGLFAEVASVYTKVNLSTPGQAIISWGNIVDAPAEYPPEAHQHEEADLSLSDITTGNASISRHGLLPKLGGGTANYLRSDGGWAMPGGTTHGTFVLAVGIPATTGANKTNQLVVTRTCTISKAYIAAKTAPVGAAFIVDINVNGVSIWASNQGNRLQLASGSGYGSQTSFDTVSLTEGDILTIDIDQVGSSTPGQDITVTLKLI